MAIEHMVSTSLCGIPLSKASLALGILHVVVYGCFFFKDIIYEFADYSMLLAPPTLIGLFSIELTNGMFGNEVLLSFMASICLVVGTLQKRPGLLLTWLIQLANTILASFLTLFYFVIASYLKAPLYEALFEVVVNGFKLYFFAVVLAHFQSMRKGNLEED